MKDEQKSLQQANILNCNSLMLLCSLRFSFKPLICDAFDF